MRQYEVLMPECFTDFSCKGGDCRYTCCNGWTISFSADERRTLQKKNKALCSHFYLLDRKQQAGCNIYAFSLDRNNNCPFLTEGKLCEIQRDYGIKPMLAICRDYPRVYHKYLNKMEHGLSLGCEKVLELLYREKDGLQFVNKMLSIPDHKGISSNIDEKERLRYPALTCYYDIQSLCIGILQAKDTEIEDRMILLGMALHHIDDMVKNGNGLQIPAYIEKFINDMESVDAAVQFRDIKTDNVEIYCSNLFSIMFLMDRKIFNDTPFNILAAKIAENLGLQTTSAVSKPETASSQYTFELSPDIYRKRKEGFRAFIKGKEYFLENLAVASLFFFDTPFRYPKRGVWNDYLYFVWVHAILKFAMTSLLDENSTVKELIDCCSIMFRKLGHSTELYNKTLDDMETNQRNSVAHMALILKSC